MRRLIWLRRELCIGSYVYSVEDYFTVLRVAEAGAIDADAEG